MKKRLLACLVAFVVAFLMAVPALATEMPVEEPAEAGGAVIVSIAPFGVDAEETQIYWRTINGMLQYRVWGITSGKWLTDWIDMGIIG